MSLSTPEDERLPWVASCVVAQQLGAACSGHHEHGPHTLGDVEHAVTRCESMAVVMVFAFRRCLMDSFECLPHDAAGNRSLIDESAEDLTAKTNGIFQTHHARSHFTRHVDHDATPCRVVLESRLACMI